MLAVSKTRHAWYLAEFKKPCNSAVHFVPMPDMTCNGLQSQEPGGVYGVSMNFYGQCKAARGTFKNPPHNDTRPMQRNNECHHKNSPRGQQRHTLLFL